MKEKRSLSYSKLLILSAIIAGAVIFVIVLAFEVAHNLINKNVVKLADNSSNWVVEESNNTYLYKIKLDDQDNNGIYYVTLVEYTTDKQKTGNVIKTEWDKGKYLVLLSKGEYFESIRHQLKMRLKDDLAKKYNFKKEYTYERYEFNGEYDFNEKEKKDFYEEIIRIVRE